MNITANRMHFKELNLLVRTSEDSEVVIDKCTGQRYIGDGTDSKKITINGIPGNALGAYLNGSKITVNGNAQDATGDTMNDGEIVIHGLAGDATGYGMRGGRIMVKGNTGYRAGIHMKAYEDKFPVLVVGGSAGSFLGEYQAGGRIIVLGLDGDGSAPVGNFCGTGMHGGKIFLRCECPPPGLPEQLSSKAADKNDIEEIRQDIEDFCSEFGFDADKILKSHFIVLNPDSKNPYKRLYTAN